MHSRKLIRREISLVQLPVQPESRAARNSGRERSEGGRESESVLELAAFEAEGEPLAPKAESSTFSAAIWAAGVTRCSPKSVSLDEGDEAPASRGRSTSRILGPITFSKANWRLEAVGSRLASTGAPETEKGGKPKQERNTIHDTVRGKNRVSRVSECITLEIHRPPSHVPT